MAMQCRVCGPCKWVIGTGWCWEFVFAEVQVFLYRSQRAGYWAMELALKELDTAFIIA